MPIQLRRTPITLACPRRADNAFHSPKDTSRAADVASQESFFSARAAAIACPQLENELGPNIPANPRGTMQRRMRMLAALALSVAGTAHATLVESISPWGSVTVAGHEA